MQKKYHLIAIGGSVMHNLAIDLKDLGYIITGSDDEIYDPSRSRLEKYGLLPSKMGWDASRITNDIDAVILGKHARKENPELIRALELGIPVMSFPEFIAANSSASTRVCIAGSHGKTSTTAMIMHVLRDLNYTFDYLVGAQLEGFEKMVSMSNEDILLVEGDEYPSSALDLRAKMWHYKPTIAVITGMAWDHVNIYKSYASYKQVFRDFLNTMIEQGICFFDQSDDELNAMMQQEIFRVKRQSYKAFKVNKKSEIIYEDKLYPVRIFGRHNMLNLSAAWKVCEKLGIQAEEFFASIASFKGASKRLELIYDNGELRVYRDFAHAPSKCQASLDAVRQKYPDKKIKAILELHTFSSLDIDYIKNYGGTMNKADMPIVFYDRHALDMKKMPDLDPDAVKNCFDNDVLQVLTKSAELDRQMHASLDDGTEVLLIMSSGTLGGNKMHYFKETES
jgi:UDP-N-acetylmuramate: L-alanyl-gamma-D-glutamyl-meso-diaminopimelate ligase